MVLPVHDVTLVEAAQAGDAAAFEALVTRHQTAVYRVALRMLGNDADAQDAAQDAFVDAWRGLDRFRHGSRFSTWLYRIVTNCCLDLLARRRPTEEIDERVIDLGSDPAELAEQHDRLVRTAGAVLRLPPEQRAPLVLRELEGLSYEDIAEALSVTVPAVKGRLHRARLALIEASVR